jgi:hypothetical protein
MKTNVLFVNSYLLILKWKIYFLLELGVGPNSTLQNRLVRQWLPLLINSCSGRLTFDVGLLISSLLFLSETPHPNKIFFEILSYLVIYNSCNYHSSNSTNLKSLSLNLFKNFVLKRESYFWDLLYAYSPLKIELYICIIY